VLKLLSLKIRFARKEGQKCKTNVQLTVPAVARASPTLQDAKRSIRPSLDPRIPAKSAGGGDRPTSEVVNASDTIVNVEVESGCSNIRRLSLRPSVSR